MRQDMPKFGNGRLLAFTRPRKSIFIEHAKNRMDVTKEIVAHESGGCDASLGIDYFLN